MRCTVHPDVHSFAAAALPWLERAPVVNSVPVSATRTWMRGLVHEAGTPFWLTVEDDDGHLVGTAGRPPGRLLLVPAMPAAVAAVIADFLGREIMTGGARPDVPGVLGPIEPAEAFAAR